MKNILQHQRWVSRIRLLAASVALTLPVVLVPTLVANPSAQAQTLTVLYSFTGGADGANPYAGLIRDAAGNLYGTTYCGGDSYLGTVFKLDATGKEIVLHSFTGADGANPVAGLIRDVPTICLTTLRLMLSSCPANRHRSTEGRDLTLPYIEPSSVTVLPSKVAIEM